MRVSVEWLGHHSYSCYFAGDIRCVGKGGDCAQPLLTLAVVREASFHCGCSLPLPSVIVLRLKTPFHRETPKYLLVSLCGSGNLFLPGQVHWRKDFPMDIACAVQAVSV